MPPARPARRWSLVAGIAVALVGLGMLGYVGWQYVGTNWVARAKQDDVVEQLERAWAALPADPPGRAVAGPAAGGDKPAPAPPPATVPVSGTTAGAILRIPDLGTSYAMPILEGTSSAALAVGVGHFTDSAQPGAVGNYALAAHRVTHGEPFRHLPDLKAGALIVIDTAKWRYTYALDTDGDELEVDFTQTWVVDDLPDNPEAGAEPRQLAGQRLITLTTCAELFHTDERLVAFGHLVDRSPRT